VLSQAEIDAYHVDGLVIPDLRLGDDTVAAMRGLMDEMLRDDPGLSTDFVPGRSGLQGIRSVRCRSLRPTPYP
jgi:hypothetical protein